FNRTAHVPLGYSREEFSRLKVSDYEFVERPEETKAHIQKIMETGRDDFETLHRRKDNEVRNILVTVQKVDFGGRPGLLTVFRDITLIKRAEEKLREARRHVYNILESTTDAFFEVDGNFNLTYINSRAEESLGLDSRKDLGKNFWELLPQAVNSFFHQELHRALREQQVVTFEEYYPPFNKWYEVWAYPTPTSLSVYFHDITSRKQLQEEREWIFQLSLDMICIAGFDGFFKELNPSWERILGWSRDELLFRPWLDFVHPDDIQATIDAGHNLKDGQAILSFENRYQCKDGSYKWISWNTYPVPERRISVAVARDVTEMIQAREILKHDRDQLEIRVQERTAALEELNRDLIKAKEEAERANRAKTEFLANISHELRTPLNPVIGFADYLLETKLDEEQHRFVVDIRESANRLLYTINNLIELTRIESRGLEPNIQPFSLKQMVEGLAKEARTWAKNKEIEVVAEIGSDTPLIVESDHRYLRKVLAVLAENAVKFTDQGRVTLSVEIEKYEIDRTLLHFMVTDTGIGIPADKLESLFTDLTQVDGSMTRNFGGLGLGLTLARRIVTWLGGWLQAESPGGGGSIFHVFLPVGECCRWEA
ncbi:MAG: PAS domain S-box protein, partial [Deltaproteobacteria bacterium]|nr:PAS domain S-box protein [Deltaproteobacteria bacterium]